MTEATTGRRGLAGSAAVMFSGTLVSRLLGLVRNIVLVAAIGVTGAANSFSVANKLPNVIYMLVAGGVLNAILVPQIVRAMKGRDGGDEYVNRLLTVAGSALLGLTLLLTGGASLLVTVYAAELDPQWFALAVAFAVWCVPQLFFYGMYTLLGQVLNARGIFGPYMWAPAVNNVVAIVGLVAYIVLFGPAATGAPEDPTAWTPLRIGLVGGTATLGVITQAVVLLVPLRRSGFRFRPRWGLRGSGLGRASRVATWAFASLALAQLGFLAISNLAAAAAGSGVARAVSAVEQLPLIAADAGVPFIPGNAAWDNANFLYILPQSLITVSLVTALFTRVSTYAAEENLAGVRADLSTGLRTIAVFTVFASAALSVVALPLVQAILPTTTFPEAQGIARVVVALLAGIAALGALTMVQRVYYAFEDTRSLFRLQIPMTAIVVLGCGLSLLLPPHWWLVGAAAATTASNLFGAVVAYLGLRRRLPSLDGARVLRTHVRLVLATVPAALVGWALLWLVGPAATAEGTGVRLLQALWRVGVAGIVMAAVYLFLLRRLGVSELATIQRPVGSALGAVARRLPRPLGSPLARVSRALTGAGGMRTMSPDPADRVVQTDAGGRALDGQETTRTAQVRPGTTLAGRYRLEDELECHIPGAECWRGRDEILERTVEAIILPGSSPTSAEALDAARRAALVSDPRLQRILDVGSQDGSAYIVADTVDGPPLAELSAGGTLPVEQARAIVGEAASALEAARRRGVHHLALSPTSVHVTAEGQVLITGVGIEAAVVGLDDTDPLRTAREDAVSLIRLLHLALTGQWPTPGAPADAPADLRDGVPGDLNTLCVVTLGPDGDGPRTPSEVIRELAPWRDINVDALVADTTWTGAPVSTPPVGASDQPDAGASAAPAVDAAGTPTGATATTAGTADPTGTAGTADPMGTATAGAGPVGPVVGAAASAGAAAAAAAGAGATAGPDGADGARTDGTPPTGPARRTIAERTSPAVPDGVPWEPNTARWAPHTLAEEPSRPRVFTAIVAPAPDVSRWTPHAPPAQPAAAPDFDEILETGAVAGTPARHQRGSQAGAAVAAAAGGLASAVGSGTRTGVDHLRRGLAGGRTRLDEAVQARAARREETRAAEASETPPTTLAGTPVSEDVEATEARALVSDDVDTTRDGGVPDGTRTDEAPFRERQLDPTPIVLVVAAILVLIASVLAFRTLTADVEPRETTTPAATAAPTPTPTPTPEAPSAPATTPPPPPPAPPQIAALAPLDPEGDGAENPELTPAAHDGDPATYWRSRSYNDPAYGMKSGIGLAVTLAEPTTVSEVRLNLMGSGGWVQIRATDPATPTEGPILAEGEMGPDAVFTLSEPTETDRLVLWFTGLPVAQSDGKNRIELAELGLG
ncbi:murein biosynthesis integral membrane protein MurJ [Georgenia faecalis]|uniref:murein biosynthesis integral membrane protein MurJ n=1 Tax=Georgenia faecalis TaxID=2483799 RepID=UPI001F49A4FE|nr:murein biosynthesis integral membrane protein MurJ [Georgenia faecalis]